MGNATNITAEAEVVKAISDAKISGIVIGSLFGLIIIYRLWKKKVWKYKKHRKEWDVLLFIFNNVLLNAIDVILDGLSAWALCK